MDLSDYEHGSGAPELNPIAFRTIKATSCRARISQRNISESTGPVPARETVDPDVVRISLSWAVHPWYRSVPFAAETSCDSIESNDDYHP